jgi:hypothetical protein
MSVEKLLHEPKRRLGNQAVFETVEEGDSFDTLADNHNTGSTLTWFPHHTTPDATGKLGDRDYLEQEGLSDFDGDSPEFVLARGNITPDNLLPELEEEQGPRGPVKSSSCCSISRSGELSTFDERLHQVRLHLPLYATSDPCTSARSSRLCSTIAGRGTTHTTAKWTSACFSRHDFTLKGSSR